MLQYRCPWRTPSPEPLSAGPSGRPPLLITVDDVVIAVPEEPAGSVHTHGPPSSRPKVELASQSVAPPQASQSSVKRQQHKYTQEETAWIVAQHDALPKAGADHMLAKKPWFTTLCQDGIRDKTPSEECTVDGVRSLVGRHSLSCSAERDRQNKLQRRREESAARKMFLKKHSNDTEEDMAT